MAVDRLRLTLTEIALFDDLTGLPNRRKFHEAAEAQIKWSRRANGKLAVLLIDVDRFKQINDTYGHAAGDACLKQIAELAAKGVGETGLVARLSGDEFGIVVADMDTESVCALAGDLVKRVASDEFRWRQHLIPLSISVGIAEGHETTASNIHELLEAADEALYQTKRDGRNGYSLGAGNVRATVAPASAVMSG